MVLFSIDDYKPFIYKIRSKWAKFDNFYQKNPDTLILL